MNYDVAINQQEDFLHFIITGENTRENVARYLQDVLRESLARDSLKILIEERLEGPRLGTLDVYQIASRGSTDAFGKLKAVAYVDVNAQGGLMQFAEDVAVNRGLRVAVFSTVAEAEEWLKQAAV